MRRIRPRHLRNVKGSLKFKMLFILCCLFFLHCDIHAQPSGNAISRSVIYMNDGSRFVGEIIQINPDSSMIIRMANGTPYALPMNQIRKIRQNVVYHKGDINRPAHYYLGAAMGMGYSRDDGMLLSEFYGGWTKNNFTNLGLASGVYRHFEEPEQLFIPLLAEWRGYIADWFLSPYVVVRGGSCIGVYLNDNDSFRRVERKYKPTFTGSAMAGLRFGNIGPAHLAVEIGYWHQYVHFTEQTFWQNMPGSKSETERTFRRLLFRLVVGF